jgi:pilus assembly protein CpaB
MSRRKIILILVVLLVAGGLVFLVQTMMTPDATPNTATTAEAPPAAEILGAAHDLPIGTLIKDADLKWVPEPAGDQNANYLVKGRDDKTALIGSVLRQSMRTDDPVTAGQVVNPHTQGFLAAVLQPGMRAMAIAVNPGGDVAGFVFPGDRVDVILTHILNRRDDPDLTDRHIGETVLTDVRVLALDQKSYDQNMDPKIAQLATLEVTPRQAEKLALASQLGTLSLSLRSLAASDTVTAPPTPDQISAATFPGSQIWDSDVSQAFPSPGGNDSLLQKVQIMRGKDKSETTFERHQ